MPRRRASLTLTELPGDGAFTIEVTLSSQDFVKPPVDESAPQIISVVDAVAMVLVDIIKTTPSSYRRRMDALQARYIRVADRVGDGDDARTAAAEEFSGALVEDGE
jgi:hypothetical protein